MQEFDKKLLEIRGNTADIKTFTKRFFHWFNAFLLMKYAHFARDHYYENIVVEEAANWLLKEIGEESVIEQQTIALLKTYRALDKR